MDRCHNAAWDLKPGFILGLITFLVFFMLAIAAFLSIENPSKFIASLPFLAGMVYEFLPDRPEPVDDVGMQLAGALLSYFLWVKRDSNFPRWGVFVLLAAALYPLVGIVIPGLVDEIVVDLGALGSLMLSRWLLPTGRPSAS